MNQPLKVALVSHSDRLGGASVVTYRLMNALRKAGVDARMVVFVKTGDDPYVVEACSRNLRAKLFLSECGSIFAQNGFSKKNLFKISIANSGLQLIDHPWVKEADVVALNWVNQGMLSLKGVYLLAQSGKPVVWTMHDMWNLTGVCHHAHECEGYKDKCGHCQYVWGGLFGNDLSRRVWRKKRELYESVPIHFVAVSNWLAQLCEQSSLLKNQSVSVIPNAFPIEFYPVAPILKVKEFGVDYSKRLILMGAARLDDPIKGLEYAIEALNILADTRPDIAENSLAVFFGDLKNQSAFDGLRFPYKHLGRVNDPKMLRQLYATGNVVISTSLYETLPGTIIEGQAAGCVPVSFGRGGQADIIDHLENGYIAEYKSAQSIADGISWALECGIDRKVLHESVRSRFASDVVAQRYIELFNRLLSERKQLSK